MFRFRMVFLLSLFLLAVTGVHAQIQSCITPPPASPILAPTIESVPRGVDRIITYTGSYVNAPANTKTVVVEINANEQQVYFGSDSDPSVRWYYNRRYRADASSPWYWQWSNSVVIMDIPSASAGPASVLYSPTPKYRRDGGFDIYKYVMYLVNQPNACDGPVGGYAYVAYSNDGVCWTVPQHVVRNGGPASPCVSGIANTWPVESLAAIDGGSTIYLIGLTGDNTSLASFANMNRSQTYIATASPDFSNFVAYVGTGEISASGVVSPTGVPNVERFRTYNYFMNLDMAFDATTGYLYLARAYPYPLDRWGSRSGYYSKVPCDWQAAEGRLWNPERGKYSRVRGCIPSPAVLPNRVQIYRMYIGTMANFSLLLTGTWTLMADWGGSVGYTNEHLAACNTGVEVATYTQLSDFRQQDVGLDPGYMSFIRDTVGNLLIRDGVATILLGDSFKKSKGFSYCLITGDERIVPFTVPR